jgi:hypothetical protein
MQITNFGADARAVLCAWRAHQNKLRKASAFLFLKKFVAFLNNGVAFHTRRFLTVCVRFARMPVLNVFQFCSELCWQNSFRTFLHFLVIFLFQVEKAENDNS